jgi:hypothetical protein
VSGSGIQLIPLLPSIPKPCMRLLTTMGEESNAGGPAGAYKGHLNPTKNTFAKTPGLITLSTLEKITGTNEKES